METHALAERRLEILMKAMRWKKSQAIGTLVLLWHDSQERMTVNATKRQILDWLDARSEKEAEKIFDALLRAQYLTELDDSTYRIRGNERHVTTRVELINAGHRGGVASGKARGSEGNTKNSKPKPKENSSLGEARLQPPRSPREPNSMQFNAIQLNSVQSNTQSKNVRLGVSPPDDPGTKNNLELNRAIWDRYRESYSRRYGTDPVRNATVNGQIASLAKRLGQEAVEVVEFFVAHSAQFYVRQCHPIGLCLKDAEALRTQWSTGKTMTSGHAKSAESREYYREQMKRIIEEDST